MTRTPTSACAAPPIMLGTNDLCPGASRIVYRLVSVSNPARPTSTVFPFERSSGLVSRAHDRYQVSRLASLASFSYFSIVRLSTIPVRKRRWPPMVDFPASTWPMKMMLRCSLPVSISFSSGPSARSSSVRDTSSLAFFSDFSDFSDFFFRLPPFPSPFQQAFPFPFQLAFPFPFQLASPQL
eukprot:Lithocolla_globosa_v1_NODE_2868_length_1841_cov_741.629899.p2 type:complete len:182 gc:universal NODE_2868_length_1841_cov_741.629899:836-291(-)